MFITHFFQLFHMTDEIIQFSTENTSSSNYKLHKESFYLDTEQKLHTDMLVHDIDLRGWL
jgi:hypothetical protein